VVPSDESNAAGVFPPTRWSLIQSAADSKSLEVICATYWRPVYGFLRRNGHSREDAEDFTQSFFSEFVTVGSLDRIAREKGKLRSFLLGALKRHLAREHRHKNRQKRGGGAVHLALAVSEMDFQEAEHQYVSLPADERSPDLVFERRWTIELLLKAHQRLERDYQAAGKEAEYQLLKSAVEVASEIDSKAVARKLGVKEASVRVLIHRLRKNFRAAFKEEIAETVGDRKEVEEEYQRLLAVFS